jgi:CheY-like chemotaxis protein
MEIAGWLLRACCLRLFARNRIASGRPKKRAYEPAALVLALSVSIWSAFLIFPHAEDTVTQEARSVLIVEDDPVFMKLLSTMLQTKGIAVQPALSAEDALQILNKQSFDVLITDLKMEGLGGVGLIRSVQNDRCFPMSRIIVITGDSDTSKDCVWIRTQKIPILRKPFTLRSLLHLVDSIVQAA